MKQIPAIADLTDELVKLPGIGKKTAERLSLYILGRSKEEIIKLTSALIKVKDEVICCSKCYSIAQSDPCYICSNTNRDHTTICVIEESHDLFAIEKAGEYKGLYYVLQGALSPLDGIGPDDLNIDFLKKRIETEQIKEVIMATNPTVEGEATAIYISKLFKPLDTKVTRIARGLPVGGDLEFADEATVMRSLEGRMEI